MTKQEKKERMEEQKRRTYELYDAEVKIKDIGEELGLALITINKYLTERKKLDPEYEEKKEREEKERQRKIEEAKKLRERRNDNKRHSRKNRLESGNST